MTLDSRADAIIAAFIDTDAFRATVDAMRVGESREAVRLARILALTVAPTEPLTAVIAGIVAAAGGGGFRTRLGHPAKTIVLTSPVSGVSFDGLLWTAAPQPRLPQPGERSGQSNNANLRPSFDLLSPGG